MQYRQKPMINNSTQKHGLFSWSSLIFLVFHGSWTGKQYPVLYEGYPNVRVTICSNVPIFSDFLLFLLQVYGEFYSLKDIVFPLGDSLVTFMHPDADKNEFLDNLAPVNTLQTYGSANLSVGYQMDNSYYTFDLSEKTYTRFVYNDDVLDFLLTGNKRGDQFDFSNTNVDFTTYFEVATGNFRKIDDRLSVGSRIKILFGEANVSTVNKDLSLITDEDWTIRSDIKIRLSVPGLNIPVNEVGEINVDY
jgi:hypothetical protein